MALWFSPINKIFLLRQNLLSYLKLMFNKGNFWKLFFIWLINILHCFFVPFWTLKRFLTLLMLLTVVLGFHYNQAVISLRATSKMRASFKA